MRLIDEGDKTVPTSISFTVGERAYLDQIVRKTGTNRHEVLSVLLKLHGEGDMVLLRCKRKNDEVLKENRLLKDERASLNDNLTDAMLKIEELEKKVEDLEKGGKPLDLGRDVREKEREKEKTKSSILRRLGGV